MAYVTKNVKKSGYLSMEVKIIQNPAVANSKAGKYPIVRPLYFYYDTKKEASVKPFVNFVLSAEGQELIDKLGYLSLK